MAAWVPPEDMTAADIVDLLGAEIAGMYADAEIRLLQAIKLEVKDSLRRHRAEQMLVRVEEMRRAAQQIVQELQQLTPEAVDRVIESAVAGGAQAAIQQLSLLQTATDITVATMGLPGVMAANLIKADLTSRLERLHSRILRYPDDIYQKVVGKHATDAVLGLATNKQTQQKIWRDFLSQGVNGFIDVSGRRWNLATYTEMATRTAVMRSYDDAHNAQLQQLGQDLVTPVVSYDACKRCAAWAGKILSISGLPGVREMQHQTQDGVFIRVNVDNTVDGARAEGFKHPNCVCVLAAYFPGLSIPMDSPGYDEEAEQAREDLRAAERSVRKAKRDLALAFDDFEETEARRDLAKARQKIQEIVKNTPQLRKRYREQLDLGHKLD